MPHSPSHIRASLTPRFAIIAEAPAVVETPAAADDTPAAPAAATEAVKFEEPAKEAAPKEKKAKDPTKLARRLSARIFGIVSPSKEKSKKEVELAPAAEVGFASMHTRHVYLLHTSR